MTFDTFLKQVHLGRRRSAIVNRSIEAALVISGTTLVVVSVGFVSRAAAAVVVVAGIVLFIILLIKRRWLSLPPFEDTCALVDTKLDLKSRATSLYYARRESTVTHRWICPVIENQLASVPLPDLRSSGLGEAISWRKVQILAAALALIAAIAAFRAPPAVNVESGNAAEKLEEFLAENPSLPKQAVEELQSLADTIRSEGLGSEAVEDQIATTLSALDEVEQEGVPGDIKKSEDAEQSNTSSSPLATPTPTSTPTPKPSASATTLDEKTDVQHAQSSRSDDNEEKSSSKKQNNKDDSSSGEKGKTADKSDGGKSDTKGGSESENESSAGAQGDENKKEAQQSSGGKGEKDSQSTQSGGNKDGSSEGSGSKGQQSSSSGGGNKGAEQKGQQGAAGEGQAGGQEGEGDQAGSQGSISERGQASPQRGGTQQGAGGEGDTEAEGKTTQQGQGKGEPSAALQEARQKVASLSKNQDTQAEVGGEKGNGKSSKNSESPSEKKGGKQGEAKQPKGTSDEEKNTPPGKGGKKGKDADKQTASDTSSAGDGDGEFTNNPPGQSASVGERSTEKMLMEGKAGGLDGPKGFKDSLVEETGLEKVDPKFGKETGKVSEHTNPAEFKRSLKKIPLAQPDAVVSKSDQPIPLEYRGVLGGE